ncbi:MAG TPA: lamin tail domain-containing protein, partial [Kiritimatiellia bacterium]|nr:lamin tail domain-containing protein [Kiritimatiellia bacterium]
SADTNTIDHAYFDEVRVGGTWDEVLNFNYPKAMNFRAGEVINGTNYVSDGQLSEIGKSWPISYTLYHRTGVTNASFNIITNVASTNGLYDPALNLLLDPADAGPTVKYRDFTNMVTERVDTNLVTLGVYTSRVWMTAVSGKATNTLFMEGMAGATDLFFGEFGEGEGYDKYVEIYNGTGGAIDLSKYVIARQSNPTGEQTNDYTLKGWSDFCRLAPTETWLAHGTTMLILNGAPSGKFNPAMTNALKNATPPRSYLVTTNEVLTVSGDDPVALFRATDTNKWIDACGIGPSAQRYIMRRLENADVPRSYPQVVDTNQWDYRNWESDRVTGYTNFLATAGLYDRDVGLGGYITFTVEDDDTDPPVVGSDTALMVGSAEPYQAIERSPGLREVVFSAWSFTNNASADACRQPWWGSLFTNAVITWSTNYATELVNPADSGTGVNDVFDGYGQINRGALYMGSIGQYGFSETNIPWIQFELPLVSGRDIVMSWAEQGGVNSFNRVQPAWSLSGQEGTFATNALWPPWTMTDAGTWRERFIEFTDVVPANVAKVYIRLILGPNYGGSSGAFRMDNIQIVGRPDELRVTDGQIAAGGYKFHVEGNIYDVDSGLQIDQATMKMANRAGVRNEGKSDIVDGGRGEDTTLWWEIGEFTKSEVTDLVNDSDVGAGLQLSVQVPDADRDRANDTLWLDGNLGRLRVVDDDTERPKLTLGTMKPRSGILAQWRFTSATNGLYPTRGDASVEFSRLMCETLNGAVSTPRFWDVSPEGGTYSVRQSGWHYNTKYWHVEMTPEADMAITNISFRSMINKPNGPTTYHIIKFVNGVSNTWLATGTFNGGAAPETNVWYTSSHSWSSNSPVLIEAGKTTQFRIWGVGGATNSIGTYWAIANLTFQQGVVGTNGVTEVTDEEFTSGSFKLTGNTWDEDSGIRGTNSTETAKRPRYSMNAPNGSVFATNVPFVFDKGFSDDGSVTTEADGKFEAPIPTPSYTNVMLGEYFGTATVWDADDDRTVDDLETRADLALYVVDNDITPPSAVGTIRVNGVAVPPTAPDRNSVLWTNKPEFLITFDSVAVDQEADESVSPKQRAVTGIGEYRVATNDVTSLTPSNRATIGRPYAVAATNGALANYGFEMTGANLGWTMDTLCQLQPLNTGGTNLVKEGFYSLRQAVGGVAYQTIQFENTAHVTPKV